MNAKTILFPSFNPMVVANSHDCNNNMVCSALCTVIVFFVTPVDPLQMLGILQEDPAVKTAAIEAKTKLEREISSLKSP